MTSDAQGIRTYLADRSVSVTQTRLAVFAALRRGGLLSLHELIIALPDHNRSSVYRTIALFEKIGVTHRVANGWKYQVELSENFHPHHHHATCRICHSPTVLPSNQQLETYVQTVATEIGFTIEAHQIELQGICKNCK